MTLGNVSGNISNIATDDCSEGMKFRETLLIWSAKVSTGVAFRLYEGSDKSRIFISESVGSAQ